MPRRWRAEEECERLEERRRVGGEARLVARQLHLERPRAQQDHRRSGRPEIARLSSEALEPCGHECQQLGQRRQLVQEEAIRSAAAQLAQLAHLPAGVVREVAVLEALDTAARDVVVNRLRAGRLVGDHVERARPHG